MKSQFNHIKLNIAKPALDNRVFRKLDSLYVSWQGCESIIENDDVLKKMTCNYSKFIFKALLEEE